MPPFHDGLSAQGRKYFFGFRDVSVKPHDWHDGPCPSVPSASIVEAKSTRVLRRVVLPITSFRVGRNRTPFMLMLCYMYMYVCTVSV
jgi:hypothetical protein